MGLKSRALLGVLVFGALAGCMKTTEGSAESAPVAVEPGQVNSGGKVSLLNPNGILSFVAQGTTEKLKLSTVATEGQSFEKVLRAEVTAPSDNEWGVQVQVASAAAVEKDDVLHVTFFARAIKSRQESGEALTEFVFELGKDPWTKSISYPVRAGKDWTLFQMPFKAAESYAAGEASVIFRMGYEPQTMEIGGVVFENHKKSVDIASLPKTNITYPGMEDDAPWRKAAEARIDQHRKADIAILVQDAAGKPLKDAEVGIEQKRHAFGFGTAAVASKVLGNDDKYKQHLTELFNMVVLENDLKWQSLAGDWGGGWGIDQAEKAVIWLNEKGMITRGHVLVWPSWRNLPKSVKALEGKPAELRAAVYKHIADTAGRMKGKLQHWDVMNEPFDNHDLMDLLGQKEMVEWFKHARKADPKAKLYINDYAILSGGGGNTAHRDHYEKTIKFLLDNGAPMDAIGMQGHFGSSLTSPDDLMKILDRYAAFKKPIAVTEYDIMLEDEEVAAKYTRDFYTTLFSHPAVDAIVMWGFWDGAHWKKRAPIFEEDWSLHASGQAYKDLVQKAWWTKEQAKTGADGSLKVRGFLGDYEVTVKHGNKTQTQMLRLVKAGSKATFKLK